ncbi:alpha-D-ribose 1-methylphosphonate 5-triphosphate synthase subunit PhnG [Bosea psychrotolerans]|uniref:Alpha-D-ribose 1-methylphosphonate 5-triphosphate synthase subunit PhnG n=2 Tax=Bosea psychrotolerans TaxID=1871628 RepID=A0A2S4LWB5_9HYPH|nr:alpha-D-ribose 1-methylphosphonate 5-triphosphate synthase subunit PhnG [Bosea psychrotolerans]
MMMTDTDPGKTAARETTVRQRWLAILARASRSEIETLVGAALPTHEILKAPETGTVMVEGRAGGAGRRFNLGEATVTRCVVRLENGAMGFSYALGRDGRKARLAAILDARLQSEDADGALLAEVTQLAAAQAAARDLASRKAAATKVDFFTLVRGA